MISIEIYIIRIVLKFLTWAHELESHIFTDLPGTSKYGGQWFHPSPAVLLYMK